ncbi:MAG: hypothetical protein KDA86_13495 [Planctomycetaceae bacterium]|nr:hypothetical protein [Planctomycetaceae bacterium]MCA9111463.1 hypothetical protein [Planctomycetaceae bacterium]
MTDFIQPTRIEPDGIYLDGDARLLLGITDAAMTRGRRSGNLRYSRHGTTILYRGEWLIEWLELTSVGGRADG